MYIFKKDDGAETWTQQAKLQASDVSAASQFGMAVSLSGNTLAVGANAEDTAASDAGAAYIFERSGTTWTQVKKITASDAAASDYFGESISTDGITTFVGAWGEDTKGSGAGAAYVFEKSSMDPSLTFDGNNKLTVTNFDSSSVGFTDAAITGTAYYPGSMTWSDNKLTSSAGNGWVKGRARTTTKFNKSTIAGIQFRVSRKADYWNMQILTPDDTETWMTSSTTDVIAQNQKPFISNQNGGQAYNVYSGGYSGVQTGSYVQTLSLIHI